MKFSFDTGKLSTYYEMFYLTLGRVKRENWIYEEMLRGTMTKKSNEKYIFQPHPFNHPKITNF